MALTQEGWALVTGHMGLCDAVLKRLGSRDDALVGDVGVPTLIRCAELWDGERSFKNYATASLYYKYARALRARRRRATRQVPAAAEARRELPALDTVDAVRYILRGVNEYDRGLLVMHYAEGMTLRDIAEALDAPKATVADHVRKALKRVRRAAREV